MMAEVKESRLERIARAIFKVRVYTLSWDDAIPNTKQKYRRAAWLAVDYLQTEFRNRELNKRQVKKK